MRLRDIFERPTEQSHKSRSCVGLRKHSWSTNDSNVNACAIKEKKFPQTPSSLYDCLHKDYMEGVNLKIFPQHLFIRGFYAFYSHTLCLSQIHTQAASSSATPGTLGNWWSPCHSREGHGYVSWRCFFCMFRHPICRLPRCARLNTMMQFKIIPNSSIPASKIPKR